MKYFGLSLLFLVPAMASAAIKFTGVAGASNSNIAAGTGTNVIIYGGMAGSCDQTDTGNDTSTCNSCDKAAGLTTCNRQKIYPNLRLRISYTSDSTDGRPILMFDTLVLKVEASSVTKGNTATVDIPWSQICNQIQNLTSSTCESGGAQNMPGTFKIGVDGNSDGTIGTGDDSTSFQIIVVDPDPLDAGDYDTIDNSAVNDVDPLGPKKGISQFVAYPGDEKVYIDDIEAGSGFPATAMGNLTTINVYASKTGFITSPAGQTPKTLTIENTAGGFSVTNKIVSDLDNGAPIYFRISEVDPAGNEVYFTSNDAINNLCGVMPPALPVPPFDGSAGQACPFAAIPDQVLGLLNKDLNCFIATAAFGSPFHPIVKDLRKFRDRFLMTNRLGRAFVKKYYEWSPPAADWLRGHVVYKWIVRVLLVPVWLGTLAAMWWPFSILLGLAGLALWRRQQRIKRD